MPRGLPGERGGGFGMDWYIMEMNPQPVHVHRSMLNFIVTFAGKIGLKI